MRKKVKRNETKHVNKKAGRWLLERIKCKAMKGTCTSRGEHQVNMRPNK